MANVRSSPYSRWIASTIARGESPARCERYARAVSSVPIRSDGSAPAALTSVSAEMLNRVVARLLGLSVVSPQPPSAF